MNKEDLRLSKRKILKCLTKDFEYGTNKRTGKPLKRRKTDQAIFDKQNGHAVFTGTDLEMVMDSVVRGLYFALDDSNAADAWILVGDSLPEHIQPVNISCIDRGESRVTLGYYSATRRAWVYSDYGGYIDEGSGLKVIAWQPLPKPLRVAEVAEAESGEVGR